MTKGDIDQIRWNKKEIEELEKRINELRQQSCLGNSIGDGMPHARNVSSTTERIALQIYDLTQTLTEKKLTLIKLVAECINYIYKIPDPLLRMIVKYRALDGMSWGQMSDILGLDRTSLSKKYDAFLKSI